jgi:hypothetical protein
VLDDVVQQPGGGDDLRAAGIAQQTGHLQRMLDERRAVDAHDSVLRMPAAAPPRSHDHRGSVDPTANP